VTAARVGTGFDAHRLVEGRPLMLGGVRIEHARGLEGHSDGDCLLHAICDAILGALGAGDMGRHFPSTDARWKGAASLRFLEEVARLLAERGYALGNLDATVIAEAPALARHLDAMRTQIAQVLAVPVESVSVKAKSTDALGAIGRGEGIAAQAVVLLQRRER
jgi:2-C-methyl-D-erythritol 4-phosphate cytidylyltransferase/2-C-methyl-D-erythritol 2,4-cyclodiphosphate synthase